MIKAKSIILALIYTFPFMVKSMDMETDDLPVSAAAAAAATALMPDVVMAPSPHMQATQAQQSAAPSTPERRGTKRKPTDECNPSPLRPSPLRGTFTRNALKLQRTLSRVSPKKQRALHTEARSLTPYLSNMYVEQYPTRNPQNISPLRQQKQNTRARKSDVALPKSHVAIKRNLFEDKENWAASVAAPYGYHVNQRDELIDPFLVDREGDGRINLQRMLEGEAPLGPDLQKINLHHWLQQDPGPVGEISSTLHNREHGVLHFPTEAVGKDRRRFDEFRRMYWQARAYDLMEKLDLHHRW